MSISQNLAEVLHRINALLPHRDEQSYLNVKSAIEDETAKPEADKADDDNEGGDQE